uniref:Single-stranded DNA-binding protein n=1 Tax=Opuntia streptacantha TaxID=393608 RepID=A0A7C9CQ12_OPUST
MMKLVGILKSRRQIPGQISSMKNTATDVYGMHSLLSSAGISTTAQNFSGSERIFASYDVYKGKAALSAQPVPPRFAKVNAGGIKVKRQGFIVLSFSPSLGERKYDWERKQVFALSATEVGSLISLGPNGSCEFFHDPAIKTSNAGQVRKSFSVKAHSDGSGYFFSLAVVNNVTKTNERFTVPITSAEFSVMRTSFSFVLPHIMGWDRYSSQLPALEENSAKAGPARLATEWDR